MKNTSLNLEFLHFFTFFEKVPHTKDAFHDRPLSRNFLKMLSFEAPSVLIKHASGRNVVLALILFIAFSGFIMPSFEADIKALSGGVGVLDLEFFYMPEKALSMLKAYGTEGIYLYLIAQWTVDLVFPAIAGFYFAAGLTWFGARRWWWMGLLVTCADWTENIFITILLLQYPEFSPAIATVSTIFTLIKWSGVFGCNLLMLFFAGKKWIWGRKKGVSPAV